MNFVISETSAAMSASSMRDFACDKLFFIDVILSTLKLSLFKAAPKVARWSATAVIAESSSFKAVVGSTSISVGGAPRICVV